MKDRTCLLSVLVTGKADDSSPQTAGIAATSQSGARENKMNELMDRIKSEGESLQQGTNWLWGTGVKALAKLPRF